MYEYGHGGNAAFEPGKGDVVDLSANMNPLGMPGGVADAIVREIHNCERYPDNFSRLLRDRIAEFEGVDPEWIFCGNGASDIIFRLPRAVRSKRVMVTAPTFADYERSAISYGSEVIYYELSAEDGFDVNDGVVDAVLRARPDLVFICNPNNPTGRPVSTVLIGILLEYCRQIGATVAVDECFLDFVERADDYTCKCLLERYQNLIIIKAFTKLFALPGIRLGYAICSDMSLVDRLYFHGADWPVSNLAQAAGVAALEGAGEYIEKTRKYVIREREAVKKRLSKMGYKVYRSEANFVFLRNPYPFNLHVELDGRGIRIRSCENFRGLDKSYCRIAVSTQENNARLLAAVKEITESHLRGIIDER